MVFMVHDLMNGWSQIYIFRFGLVTGVSIKIGSGETAHIDYDQPQSSLLTVMLSREGDDLLMEWV